MKTMKTMKTMKILLDQEVCTGHGRCYVLAPDIFSPDDHGHAQIIGQSNTEAEVPEHLADQARAAVANCPERAITVVD